MENIRILELFSGIGGMNYAFKYSNIPGKVVTAVDINPIANKVYQHNHPEIKILNNNIQKLTPKIVKNLNVNVILMSPPCQPFTRVGCQKGLNDNRCDALKHICELLKDLSEIDFILMENVKGFEISTARNLFIDTLKSTKFYYREFILSPSQFGVPNTRYRYFCLARRKNDFSFGGEKIWTNLPGESDSVQTTHISDVLESNSEISTEMYLSENILEKRLMIMDIVSAEDINSCCFTKAYTHYAEGTGSVFSSKSRKEINEIFDNLEKIDKHSVEYLKVLKSLRIRYFTTKEVSKLMSFPNEFDFPKEVTSKQKYRLLGNSINVLVVGKLIRTLFSGLCNKIISNK